MVLEIEGMSALVYMEANAFHSILVYYLIEAKFEQDDLNKTKIHPHQL